MNPDSVLRAWLIFNFTPYPGHGCHFDIDWLIDQSVLNTNLLKHLDFLCIGNTYAIVYELSVWAALEKL